MARMPTEFIVRARPFIDLISSEGPPINSIKPERIARILGVALEREFFTAKEVARQAGVTRQEAKCVFGHYRDAFEQVFAPRYLLKGEWLLGLRVRPNQKSFISRRIEQLVPKELMWINPRNNTDQYPMYLDTLASAEDNYSALQSACERHSSRSDEVATLWAGVVSDLEIARQEITDHTALGAKPSPGISARMLATLVKLRELTVRYRLADTVFQGSGSPLRALNRLENNCSFRQDGVSSQIDGPKRCITQSRRGSSGNAGAQYFPSSLS